MKNCGRATNSFPVLIDWLDSVQTPLSNMADNDYDDVAGFYDRARLLQSKGFHSDALKELDKVIELAGQCKVQSESLKRLLSCAWNDRGHLKYLQVNFDDAIYDYTRAIERDKDFAVPYYNRGQIHYRMGM